MLCVADSQGWGINCTAECVKNSVRIIRVVDINTADSLQRNGRVARKINPPGRIGMYGTAVYFDFAVVSPPIGTIIDNATKNHSPVFPENKVVVLRATERTAICGRVCFILIAT